MDLYILLLSTYPSQYHAILVPWCISLSYFHLILLYLHNILLPKISIPILVFQVWMHIKYHQWTFSFQVSHYTWNTIFWWNWQQQMYMIWHYVTFYYFYSFIFTISRLYWINSIFRLYLGVNTIWYLHNHFVCDKLLCLLAIIKSSFLYFRAWTTLILSRKDDFSIV